jgi:hypothetical protein
MHLREANVLISNGAALICPRRRGGRGEDGSFSLAIVDGKHGLSYAFEANNISNGAALVCPRRRRRRTG